MASPGFIRIFFRVGSLPSIQLNIFLNFFFKSLYSSAMAYSTFIKTQGYFWMWERIFSSASFVFWIRMGPAPVAGKGNLFLKGGHCNRTRGPGPMPGYGPEEEVSDRKSWLCWGLWSRCLGKPYSSKSSGQSRELLISTSREMPGALLRSLDPSAWERAWVGASQHCWLWVFWLLRRQAREGADCPPTMTEQELWLPVKSGPALCPTFFFYMTH